MKKLSQSPRAANRRWNEAIDWLLNSRHTADPDIQGPFWAYCDGLITRSELDHFSAEDVREREESIQRSEAKREGGEPR